MHRHLPQTVQRQFSHLLSSAKFPRALRLLRVASGIRAKASRLPRIASSLHRARGPRFRASSRLLPSAQETSQNHLASVAPLAQSFYSVLDSFCLDARCLHALEYSHYRSGYTDSIAMTLLQQCHTRCVNTDRWFSPVRRRLLLKSAVMAGLAVLSFHPVRSWRVHCGRFAQTFAAMASSPQ